MSPFEIVYGFNSIAPTDLLPLPRNEHMNLSGRDRARKIQELHKNVRQNLEKSTATYARYASRGKKELILYPGDWVWLHLRKERFAQRRGNKLSNKDDGPFRVIERINDNAYRIELPEEYGVHATFNIADLKLFERADEEEANRLMDQPSEGGGDDRNVRSQPTLPVIQLREGPISRGSSNKFINKILDLLNNFQESNLPPDNYFYNFKNLINPGGKVKILIALEDGPTGLDI